MKLINKPLVIVGIDPGTTMGYAIIDINGNFIKADSRRGGSLSELITAVTYYGRPVLVGTDKAKCPELVYQFSAKTGARVVTPYADLLISEKKVFTSGYGVRNDHEADALASAFFAHKRYSALLYKTSMYLRNASKENIADEVKRLVILSDGLSIADAIRMVEKRESEARVEESHIDNVEPEEFVPSKSDYLRLKEKLKRVEEEYRVLKSNHDSLSDELEKKEEKAERKGGLASNRKINQVLRHREKLIRGEGRIIEGLNKRVLLLKRFLAEAKEKAVLKRLESLDYDEFLKRNKVLRVGEGDILLVENPTKHSQKTFDYIRGKVGVIVYRKEINKDLKNIKDFVWLDGSKLKIEEEDDFGLTSREEIERLKRESNSFLGLFEKYKESRKKER